MHTLLSEYNNFYNVHEIGSPFYKMCYTNVQEMKNIRIEFLGGYK